MKQIENGTIRPGHYYNIGDNTFDYQEIEYRYDKRKPVVAAFIPPQVIVSLRRGEGQRNKSNKKII